MTVEARWPVPRGWDWTSIESIADVTGGGTPSANDPLNFADDEGIPWITPADLTGYEDTYIARGRRNLSERGYKSSSAKLLPAGAVLFTSRAPIGYCAIAANPIATNQGFKSLTLFDGISGVFTRHYLKWSKPYLESLACGTTFLELSGSKLQQVPFPLPPLAEQKRIVAKLDALNAKSARARAELARIETLVSRYKQAVLSKAFSGELTREWERLPLSDALRQAQIGLVRSKEQQFANGGTPYVRMNHFDLEGRWHLDDITHVEASAEELRQFALQTGDLLFNTRNSFELVGKVAYWEGGQGTFLYNNNILRMRFEETIDSKFAFFQMQSAPFRTYLENVKSATTSVCAIYQKALVQAPFVLPRSLTEQYEIVRRIEAAFAKIDRLAKEAKRALELVGRLDEAILAKAFRGELVPQVDTDEPADRLLARIRAERQAAPKGKRGRKAGS